MQGLEPLVKGTWRVRRSSALTGHSAAAAAAAVAGEGNTIRWEEVADNLVVVVVAVEAAAVAPARTSHTNWLEEQS